MAAVTVTFMRAKVLATATVDGTRGTGFPAPTEESGPFEVGTTTDNIAIGATSVASATAFVAGFPIIRVATESAACRIAFGTAPTATATDAIVGANSEHYFKIVVGDKMAAIQV